MTYQVRKLHYLTQSLIPIGWLVVVVWSLAAAKDIETVLISGGMAVVLFGLFGYAIYKQSRTPIVETSACGIKINNVWRSPEQASWDDVVGLKKQALFGYKLNTLGRDIWLPIGMLTKNDGQELLREVSKHVQNQT